MKTNLGQQLKKIMKGAISLFVMILVSAGMSYAQQKTTMNVKDLDSKIENYVEKNYKDYKIVEGFKYDLVYETKIQKENVSENLVFDSKGKFLYKKTAADNAKVSLQTRSTIALDDVESDINQYIKKNFAGYKLTEAFKFEVVYTAKIMKGALSETLVFDKDGKFMMKEAASAAAPSATPPAAKPATVAPPAAKPATAPAPPAKK